MSDVECISFDIAAKVFRGGFEVKRDGGVFGPGLQVHQGLEAGELPAQLRRGYLPLSMEAQRNPLDQAPDACNAFDDGLAAAGDEASPLGTGVAALDTFAVATDIVAVAVGAIASAVGKVVSPVGGGLADRGLVVSAVGGVLKAVALEVFLSCVEARKWRFDAGASVLVRFGMWVAFRGGVVPSVIIRKRN